MSSDCYVVTPVKVPAPFTVTVPGSKSITNRALLLAALSDGACTLKNALFSSDSRALITALQELGIDCSADETTKEIKNSVPLNPLPLFKCIEDIYYIHFSGR